MKTNGQLVLVPDLAKAKRVRPSTPEQRARRRAIYAARPPVLTPERVAAKAAYMLARRRANPERENVRMRAWHLAHPEKAAIYNKARNLSKHGLTESALAVLLEVQGGLCGICRAPLVGGRQTHVDHDHTTGRVRGLLCGGCNVGLGHFRDNPTALEAAAAYLRKANR